MIEGRDNSIPDESYWDLYRNAERDHHDLITALAQEVRDYASGRNEFNSNAARREILERWPRRDEYNRLFPDRTGSQLFGMVAMMAMINDNATWSTRRENVGGRLVRVYSRASE
jgi:hypothetical protein